MLKMLQWSKALHRLKALDCPKVLQEIKPTKFVAGWYFCVRWKSRGRAIWLRRGYSIIGIAE